MNEKKKFVTPANKQSQPTSVKDVSISLTLSLGATSDFWYENFFFRTQ
jgi:hypothetical protein